MTTTPTNPRPETRLEVLISPRFSKIIPPAAGSLMNRFLIVQLVFASLLLPPARGQTVPDQKTNRPAAKPPAPAGIVEFSTLITAQDVTRQLSTDAGVRDAAKRFRAIGIRRLWIETIRSGHRADLDTLRRARDLFREEGFIASGALTVTWGPGFGAKDTGGHFLCYSAPETHKALAETAAQACSLFDEVMYDDFLATHCRCERCAREKGDRSWADYRCEIKSRVARDYILKPGHDANPDCVIIIKYPQWYDKFHRHGYDVIRDTENFDAIWVGTETRGPDTKRFGFVPPYQSTVVFRWLSSIGRGKTRGGWFDPYDCTPDEYVDQAYCTVLAGATELMRFNAFEVLPDGPHKSLMALFGKHRAHVEALAKLIHGRSPIGLLAYKPPYSNSGNEDYFLDYLGNMGIPLIAAAHFPTPQQTATLVLTRSARHDKTIDDKVLDWAKAGGSLIATTGFLADAGDGVRKLFGLGRVNAEPIDADALFVGDKQLPCAKPMSLGGVLQPAGAAVRLAGQSGQQRVPVFTVASTPGGGFAAAINLRTNDTGEEMLMDEPVHWMDLPEEAANVVRETALTGTGLKLIAPSRVLVHPFSGNCISLINARGADTPIRLKLSPPWFTEPAKELTVFPSDKKLTPSKDGTWELTLPPRARWTLFDPKGKGKIDCRKEKP